MMGFSHIQGEFCCNHIFCLFILPQISTHTFCFSCSEHQQNSYYEASDNVYEDVENINKFFLGQNSRKRKGGPKSKNVYLIQHVIYIKQFFACLPSS